MIEIEYYNFEEENVDLPIYLVSRLDRESFQKILDVVDHTHSESFEHSMIYHKLNKENVLNTDIRSSKKATIKDPEITKLIEHTISEISKQSGLEISLVHNTFDIIKYESGDFFKPHNDFVGVTNDVKVIYSNPVY